MPNATLRKNEQLLRRCPSIETAKTLVSDLICQHGDLQAPIGVTESGKPIYQIGGLDDFCFYIPQYLEDGESLAEEIMTNWINAPPHSNSFNTSENSDLWREYLHAPATARLQHLRWSCVGYHYDWTNRSYEKDRKSAFPASFESLYTTVLNEVNKATNLNLNGTPESAIINFYHSQRISDRLGGHRDDVESTDDSPLVSVSMGLSGVFLIESKALVLKHGDVLVLAGKARQSLHGVPCIFRTHKRARLQKGIKEFLSKTRISISIRQVY